VSARRKTRIADQARMPTINAGVSTPYAVTAIAVFPTVAGYPLDLPSVKFND
jgi:hypothetical protein